MVASNAKKMSRDDDPLLSNESAEDSNTETYESIMAHAGGVESLTSRLKLFREWIREVGCEVHPSVCIVNGEATDGTKNAPVLVLGNSSGVKSKVSSSEERCGIIDGDEDRELYDRTIGCQLRTTKELKEKQVLMTVPKGMMVTPDLVAASDAGMAIRACCQPMDSGANFWDAFSNTTEKETKMLDKIASSSGTQLLIKILQERKKIETELAKAAKKAAENLKNKEDTTYRAPDFSFADKGTVSTRAVVLCFLIHQRFSNHKEPKVSASNLNGRSQEKDGAGQTGSNIPVPIGSPITFAPYLRTLPPSVPLPICWKRNELALLAKCVTGVPLLQEVAAQIMTLSADLMSLLKAGILHRFPSVITPNLLTWDRWVWAASTHMSRILPATCYLNKGEDKAIQHELVEGETFYSPSDIWDELGVMIPLFDMLNHESEASQIIYEAPPPPSNTDNETVEKDSDEKDEMYDVTPDAKIAKVIIHKRVKKGSQVYTNYSIESNKELMLTYGFAQMNNMSDAVAIGWGLTDCVGNVPSPPNYDALDEAECIKKGDEPYLIFDSNDTEAINSWWTKERLNVLENEIQSDGDFWSLLRKGKKMTATASCDGTFHPILLTAVVVGTMTPGSLAKRAKLLTESNGDMQSQMTITKRHQRLIQRYLIFLFSRKFERLMQSFNDGLQDHFNHVKLWTKPTQGGLLYNSSTASDVPEEDAGATGWQIFFDTYAYTAAMEIEKRYYSISPESCVLTLYDGNLRSLQASINGIVSQDKFKEGVLKQLGELGFVISDTESADECESVTEDIKSNEEGEADEKGKTTDVNNSQISREAPLTKEEPPKKDSHNSVINKNKNNNNTNGAGGTKNNHENEKNFPRNRRNRRRNGNPNGPPAIKLHIGNLSFQTNPSTLFDYFAKRYGRDSVLECHIPTQRETGKSRGFGFVTMPELAAIRVLESDDIHEIDGRKVKVAESNTAGGTRGNHQGSVGGFISNDRCRICGYSPKYCTCNKPNGNLGFPPHMGSCSMPIMGGTQPAHPAHTDDMYGQGLQSAGMEHQDHQRRYGRSNVHPDFDRREGGRHRSRSRNRGRSYSRSHSPRYRSGNGRGDRSREGRIYDSSYRDRGRDRSYSRSRPRSYSRGRSRRDRRGKDNFRDSDRDREGRRRNRRSRRSSSRSDWRSSRYSSSRSRSRSRSRSHSYSKSTQSSSRRTSRKDSKKDRVSKSSAVVNSTNLDSSTSVRSQSISPPPQARDVDTGHKKREGGKSRRSRSKSRDRSSRSRKRHKGSRRSKEAPKRYASRSRSRSCSWKN